MKTQALNLKSFVYVFLTVLLIFGMKGAVYGQNLNVGKPRTVRMIYFLPNDRPARPERVAAFRELIKEARQFFADEMQRHGYGRKTFNVETNASGEPLIHHFDGKFEDAYYHKSTPSKVWEEITKQFDVAAHVYLCMIDISIEGIGTGDSVVCGDGSTVMRDRDPGQDIIIPASGRCLNERAYALVAHELGHAFGLAHDFRDDAHVMSYGARPNELSSCAAEWLDVSPFLNIDSNPANVALQFDTETTVKMLPPIEVPPNGVRIRFEINDPDGLHQAQLYIPTTDKDPVEGSGFKLHSCKSLSGEISTLEFITTELPREDMFVRLRVMDVRGNFSWWNHYFRFQATDILRKSPNRVGAVDAAGSVPETLQKISGDNQRGFLNKRLVNPFVVSVRDADNEPVAGIQVKFRVTQGGGKLSITNPWTDSNGRAQTFLTLSGLQANRVEASVFGVSQGVTFSTDSQPRVLIAPSQRPPMYWIDTRDGTLHRLVGSKVENLLPSVKNATNLATDVANEKLYWTEQVGKNRGRITSADLDGSNVQVLVNIKSGVPRSIAIDSTQGKLYWTDSRGRIQRANLNGKGIRNLIRNLKSPENITVDVAGGKLYWTEDPGGIRRANLNGKSIEDIASNLDSLTDIAISGNKIYWTEVTGGDRGKIGRANLNGSNARTLAMPLNPALNVAIDTADRKLYWSDSTGKIRRSNLVGRHIKSVVSDLAPLADFALVSSDEAIATAPPISASLPENTQLQPNYPNPFNPETWIPYQLVESADVTLTIYSADGKVVRTLVLGHQSAGMYHSKSRAVYWDGRNRIGEPVASGVYFYTLIADGFTATRKMLILK